MSDDLPPWEPIADALAGMGGVPADREYQDTREPQNATQHQIRKRYAKTAKAIAYNIAVEERSREGCDDAGGPDR